MFVTAATGFRAGIVQSQVQVQLWPHDSINATLGVHYGRYEIALTGDNLGDKRGPTIVFGALTAGAGITPRTIGLRFRIDSQ